MMRLRLAGYAGVSGDEKSIGIRRSI